MRVVSLINNLLRASLSFLPAFFFVPIRRKYIKTSLRQKCALQCVFYHHKTYYTYQSSAHPLACNGLLAVADNPSSCGVAKKGKVNGNKKNQTLTFGKCVRRCKVICERRLPRTAGGLDLTAGPPASAHARMDRLVRM